MKDAALLLLISEAESIAAKSAMDDHSANMQEEMLSVMTGIGQCMYSLQEGINTATGAALLAAENAKEAAEMAQKAANKKPPKMPEPKKQDYVMDVVRDDDGLIMRVDVRSV